MNLRRSQTPIRRTLIPPWQMLADAYLGVQPTLLVLHTMTLRVYSLEKLSIGYIGCDVAGMQNVHYPSTISLRHNAKIKNITSGTSVVPTKLPETQAPTAATFMITRHARSISSLPWPFQAM